MGVDATRLADACVLTHRIGRGADAAKMPSRGSHATHTQRQSGVGWRHGSGRCGAGFAHSVDAERGVRGRARAGGVGLSPEHSSWRCPPLPYPSSWDHPTPRGHYDNSQRILNGITLSHSRRRCSIVAAADTRWREAPGTEFGNGGWSWSRPPVTSGFWDVRNQFFVYPQQTPGISCSMSLGVPGICFLSGRGNIRGGFFE